MNIGVIKLKSPASNTPYLFCCFLTFLCIFSTVFAQAQVKSKNLPCECLEEIKEDASYASPVKNLISYPDFVHKSGWQFAESEKALEDIYFSGLSSDVGFNENSLSLNLLAFHPIRLLYPNRLFGINFTPCIPADKNSNKLSVHLNFSYPFRNDFIYSEDEPFDHSVGAYYDYLLLASLQPEEEVLKEVIQRKFDSNYKDFVKSVNAKYRTNIELTDEDSFEDIEIIFSELSAKEINAKEFILNEYILTPGHASTSKMDKAEADRFKQIFKLWLGDYDLKTIIRKVQGPVISAYIEAKQIGIEISEKVIRQWDTTNNTVAKAQNRNSLPAKILLGVEEFRYDPEKGIEAPVKETCSTFSEITGTRILVNFNKAELVSYRYPPMGVLTTDKFPLLITDPLVKDSHDLEILYPEKVDTLLLKFSGLHVPDASLTLPLKSGKVTANATDLLINNFFIAGTIEVPIISINASKFKISTGKTFEEFTIPQLQAHLLKLVLTQVKLKKSGSKLKVYFKKYSAI